MRHFIFAVIVVVIALACLPIIAFAWPVIAVLIIAWVVWHATADVKKEKQN